MNSLRRGGAAQRFKNLFWVALLNFHPVSVLMAFVRRAGNINRYTPILRRKRNL